VTMTSAPSLTSEFVDIWTIDRHDVDGDIAVLRGVLDADERSRASRFLLDAECARFVVAHAIVRWILAGYLAVRPADVQFHRHCPVCGQPHGKPAVVDASAVPITFSLSHSGDRVAVAAAAGVDVGIDVEEPDAGRDLCALLPLLAAGERCRIMSLPPSERPEATRTTWVRKEAYAKARGLGLALPLPSYEVTVPPLDAALLADASLDAGRAVSSWRIVDLTWANGVTGAVAYHGAPRRVRFRSVPGDLTATDLAAGTRQR